MTIALVTDDKLMTCRPVTPHLAIPALQTNTMFEFNENLKIRIAQASQSLREELLNARQGRAHWTGELSSSALATATAISALSQYRDHALWPCVERSRIQEMIDKGSRWLLNHQNQDGGWGDTDRSHSNIATSMLAVAALTLAGKAQEPATSKALEHANQYIDGLGRVDALRRRYGKDKTFAVPILANCAIAGLVPWSDVAALPFEAAVVSQKFYRFMRLPVVSYAIPALVGIGQAKFLKSPPRNPITRLIRRRSIDKSLEVLNQMQPASGGYLEAIPLTCFVAMSLAHTERPDHEVTHQCIKFVERSFYDLGDIGTWPIDTNLATWNTTLAINALGDSVDDSDNQPTHLNDELLSWLLDCQMKETHPFTGAAPGGWGWSDLSGAVPDADDTPGALLALRHWFQKSDLDAKRKQEIHASARAGCRWLLDLQNNDRGWPTFCRGWGRLPFDRSGSDITAHVIRALYAWQSEFPDLPIESKIKSGFEFLRRQQSEDGSWYPLWFGNQDHPEEENPVYGTVKVLLAFVETGQTQRPAFQAGMDWILQSQNKDFGWGGGTSHETNLVKTPGDPGVHTSSIQETALVIDLLAKYSFGSKGRNDRLDEAILKGTECLLLAFESGKTWEKWPIGFYFAKLWYYEALYPLIFAVSAMTRLRNHLDQDAHLVTANEA